MASEYLCRANWKDPELVKFYLDLCIEEVSNKGKNGGSLKKESWQNIERLFLEKKNVKVNKAQLKNLWDYSKKKYTIWSNLVTSAIGHGFNPETNTMNWNAERWDDYIKGNPDAKQFRYIGLQNAEEMKFLFDGIAATGRAGWGPSKEGMPKDDIGLSSMSQVEPESSEINIDLDSESPIPPSSPIDVQPKNKRHKKKESSEVDKQIERVLKTLEKSDGPSLEECNKILDTMEKLQMDDPIYIAACSIFCESQAHREQWIMLTKKPEEVRVNWIQMNAKN